MTLAFYDFSHANYLKSNKQRSKKKTTTTKKIMGCSLSTAPTTAVAPTEQLEDANRLIFSVDERLKLKEIWVIVKQNNMKKLGDEIMNK